MPFLIDVPNQVEIVRNEVIQSNRFSEKSNNSIIPASLCAGSYKSFFMM